MVSSVVYLWTKYNPKSHEICDFTNATSSMHLCINVLLQKRSPAENPNLETKTSSFVIMFMFTLSNSLSGKVNNIAIGYGENVSRK